MRSGRAWAKAILCLGLVGLTGCKPPPQKNDPAQNQCASPCEEDPSETCYNPCGAAGTPGTENPGGFGGTGGATGGGGSGGISEVTVSGTVVQFSSIDFDVDTTAPYTDSITILAPGLATTTVETTAASGSFELSGVASGADWVLAKDLDGVGGAFSTYSYQKLFAGASFIVPVVPVDLLTTVGTQIDVPSLVTGTAHFILKMTDPSDVPLEGVEVALSGASIGYDVGPGQYSANVVGTSTAGTAVGLNVSVPSEVTASISLTLNGGSLAVPLRLAPDTVTYALMTIDTSP